MNTFKSYFKFLAFGSLAVVALVFALTAFDSGAPKADAAATLLTDQHGATVGAWQFTSVAVVPDPTTSSNALVVWDTTGTNAFRINATNSAIEMLWGGTNAAAVNQTNLTLICTNSGAGTVFQRTLQFRNGVLTLCTSP